MTLQEIYASLPFPVLDGLASALDAMTIPADPQRDDVRAAAETAVRKLKSKITQMGAFDPSVDEALDGVPDAVVVAIFGS